MFEHHIFTLILQYALKSRHIKWSDYWHLCCGLVSQPLAHWLVYAQPLFLSVNRLLDQSTSNSSSSSSSQGPDLAECQYLGRTPSCHHNNTLMHMKVSRARSQFKHQSCSSRTNKDFRSFSLQRATVHALFYTILRQTRHTCLIP